MEILLNEWAESMPAAASMNRRESAVSSLPCPGTCSVFSFLPIWWLQNRLSFFIVFLCLKVNVFSYLYGFFFHCCFWLQVRVLCPHFFWLVKLFSLLSSDSIYFVHFFLCHMCCKYFLRICYMCVCVFFFKLKLLCSLSWFLGFIVFFRKALSTLNIVNTLS